MRKTGLLLCTAAVTAALLFVGLSFAGQQRRPTNASPSASRDPATVPVIVTVTVLGANFSPAAALMKDDIAVYSNKTRENVASLERTTDSNAGLQLALLIDDDDSPSALGPHFPEIKSFIEDQPAATQVGIYYARAGTVQAAAKFSADHTAVARKLRLPLGKYFGSSPSVYLSLESLAKNWPANNMRHEVLMIASGSDRLHPGWQDPYLDEAIHQVQKDGVVVHTIYSGGFRLARAQFLQQIAWQNLSRVADGSGGQQFFQGFETPVDFLPIFHKLNLVLGNQYRLTVDMPRSSNRSGQMQPIHIRTEQNGVHLSYASQVFVPRFASEPKSGS